MACKSLIYVANTNSASVVANGTLPIATVVRRRGSDVNLGGNSIVITDTGSNYYLVSVTATFTVPVAGDVSLTLQQNGTNVTGATASTSVTTATTEVRSLSFTAIIRTFNSCSIDNLTVINSGVAATYSNIAVSVEKL